MDIEEVAHSTPEKIITFSIDPATGVCAAPRPDAGQGAGPDRRPGQAGRASCCGQLYKAFVDKDMAMLEINPLIVTGDDQLRVLDAKVGFDDNALFRHPDISALRDETEEDAKEIEASKYDLSYIALDGEIGCMVNGAGLAMATMDIIKLYGAEPANFLDVGGGADEGEGDGGLQDHHRRPQREGHPGQHLRRHHARCDIMAEGVVAAVKEVGLKVPLVVRLEGTNVELGKKIINESGLNVIAANDLSDGAEKIVKAVRGAA